MSEFLFPLDGSPIHQIRPDLKGTVCEGEGVTLVRWDIPADRSPTPIHSHTDHEQFTIIVTGSVETTVGDQVLILHPGDMCRIDRNVPHGKTRALNGINAVLIDVFSPPRDEYVAAARG
ncbi:MAG: cupin domain-containing protein [Rhizobiaceae bacterium]|nr:cupin domain-containing protein [Rhizobiaceae bacterium]